LKDNDSDAEQVRICPPVNKHPKKTKRKH